jgi:hypothetical protein
MSLDLSPSVHKIFAKVKSLSGKDVKLIEKRDLDVYASVKIARKSMADHLMYYKPEHTGIINHLIAHECGHILRIYGIEPEGRLVSFTNDQLKLKALKDIESEIQKLSKMLPFKELVQIANIWYTGIIRQLTGYPSDIMIEKWIHDEYPDLRPYQSKCLKKQYDEAVQALSNRVERMTPYMILWASNGMNYAFFHMLEAHFKDNYHLERYDRSAYANIGKELILLRQEQEDTYEGDIHTVNEWAKALKCSHWFAWQDFEDIPDNYQNTF